MRRLALLLLCLTACGDDDDGPVVLECGIDAPGSSRCLDEKTLERCKVTGTKEEVDCGEGFCGPSREIEGGAECLTFGSGCGDIDRFGACLGDVLAWCYDQRLLVVTDCAAEAAFCALVSEEDGFNCATDCSLAGVTAEGRCNGNSIDKCELRDGTYQIVQQACPAGNECVDFGAVTGWAGCQPLGDCASLGPAGSCAGEVLSTCVDGQPTQVDCTAAGNVCTFGGEIYMCAPPGSVGARRVAGTVRYEDRPPLPSGKLGPIVTAPARRVSVAVVSDEDGSVLAAGYTADDGSYSLAYDAADGSQQHVLVATTSNLLARPLRIIRADGLVHGLAGASFTASARSTSDLLARHVDGLAGAFNIYDMGVHAFDLITVDLGETAEPLFIVWARGSDDGTYFAFSNNGIFLLGGPADDDGHDDPVILHGIGHYFEDTVGRTDSPGGYHDGDPTDPTLAWSEGFATYFSAAVSGSPIYVDSNANGGWARDNDLLITETPDPGGRFMQDVAEMVTEILWDLGDSGASDDDEVAGDHITALRVQPDYLGAIAVFADRGVIGVDLVDFLDGWFIALGLDACAGAHQVVTEVHKFPYDFAGSAGACP